MGDFCKEQDEDLQEGVTAYVKSCIPDAEQAEAWRSGSTGEMRPICERFWLVDPIDGTKGFLRGGQFAVALSLLG